MIVGITATQKGLVDRQREVLRRLFLQYEPKILVHGDCLGGDADSHSIYQELFPDGQVYLRPCTIHSKRAFCMNFAEEYTPEPPLVRNKKIVEDCKILIALPGEQEEVLRSGTWSTIRYAKKRGKPVIIVYPKPAIYGLFGVLEETFNMRNFRG